MDYVWEREGKGAWAGLAASLRRFGLALNVGIPFALWMSVPVLAWTVGPIDGRDGGHRHGVCRSQAAQVVL